mgnify:FL=1
MFCSYRLCPQAKPLRGLQRLHQVRKRNIAHVCDLLRVCKANRDVDLRFPSSGAFSFFLVLRQFALNHIHGRFLGLVVPLRWVWRVR